MHELTDKIIMNGVTEITKIIQLEACIDRAGTDTIFFFDIDNTIIRLMTDICSDEWIKWQVELFRKHDSHPLHGAETLSSLYELYCKWMICEDYQTIIMEEDTVKIINRLFDSGHKVMLVTARNPVLVDVTEKHLNEHIDISKLYNPSVNNDTSLIKNGICYLSGKNKGKFIKSILDKNLFNEIIFVDDSLNECNNVNKELRDLFSVRIYNYTNCHVHKKIFDEMDKDILHEKWIRFTNSQQNSS